MSVPVPLLNLSTRSTTSGLAFTTAYTLRLPFRPTTIRADVCAPRTRRYGGNGPVRVGVTCMARKKRASGSGGASKRTKKSGTPTQSDKPSLTKATASSPSPSPQTEETENEVPSDEQSETTPERGRLIDSTPSLEAIQFIAENSTATQAIGEEDDDEGAVARGKEKDEKDEETKKLNLPDLKMKTSTIKRKRDRQRSRLSKAEREKQRQMEQGSKPQKYTLDEVREMARAYRLGDKNDEKRQKLIDEIERQPDFILQASASATDYDLTSAIFGTGKPNKQGIYVLPYLQSAHIVLLAIALLVAFVYYPGFPLTEADDDVRSTFKNTLLVVFSVNSVLAFLAAKAATKRQQPPGFWAFKTFVLGELAYGELRRNTKIANKEQEK